MASLKITEAEIFDALVRAAGTAPGEARTVVELVEATGLSPRKIHVALQHYQRLGRLQPCRVLRHAIDGRLMPIVAYTILPTKRRAT